MGEMGDLDMMVSSQGQGSHTHWGQEWGRSNSDCWSQRGRNSSEWVESCEGSWSNSERSWSNSEWSGSNSEWSRSNSKRSWSNSERSRSNSKWSWRWWWGQGEGQWSRGRTEELSGLSGFVLFPPDDSPLASPLTPRHLVPHHLAPIATHADDVTEAGLGSLGQSGHHRQAEQHEQSHV